MRATLANAECQHDGALMVEYSLPLVRLSHWIDTPSRRVRSRTGHQSAPRVLRYIRRTHDGVRPPVKPGSHHPGPWGAVRGGFTFQSRVELSIYDLGKLDGFSPSLAAWLIAVLFRLKVEAPVRVPALASVPLKQLSATNGMVDAFESAQHQIGLFRGMHAKLSIEDLHWIAATLPVAARLYQDNRFMRALCTPIHKLGTILVWTAIEILLDKSAERNKTKAICSALSEFVAVSPQDRDHACNVIRDLYEKRGRIVHVGRKIAPQDFGQSFALARAAFMNVLNRDKLPSPHTRPMH